jgi:hypothetical protein
MKEFILIFRQPDYDYSKESPEEMTAVSKKWQDWFEDLTAKGKLSSTGPRIGLDGKVLKPGGVITGGPFVEMKERLGGFMFIKADSLEDATELAQGCPALEADGSVEVRPIIE